MQVHTTEIPAARLCICLMRRRAHSCTTTLRLFFPRPKPSILRAFVLGGHVGVPCPSTPESMMRLSWRGRDPCRHHENQVVPAPGLSFAAKAPLRPFPAAFLTLPDEVRPVGHFLVPFGSWVLPVASLQGSTRSVDRLFLHALR